MNTLEKLRLAHVQRCQTVDVGGVPVVLAPMNALDGMAIQKKFGSLQGLANDNPVLLDFYVELIALSAVEPETHAMALDSVEGRALVRGLPLLTLFELGSTAAQVNGFLRAPGAPEPKKNSRKRKS